MLDLGLTVVQDDVRFNGSHFITNHLDLFRDFWKNLDGRVDPFLNVDFFSLHSAQQQPYASGLGVFSDIADANISVHFIDVRPNETTFVAETN